MQTFIPEIGKEPQEIHFKIFKKKIFTANPLSLTLTRTESSNIHIYIYIHRHFLPGKSTAPNYPNFNSSSHLCWLKKINKTFLATRSLHDTSQGLCCCHVSVAELVSIASTFGTVATSTGGAVLRVTAKKPVGDVTHNSPFHQDLKLREMQSFLGFHPSSSHVSSCFIKDYLVQGHPGAVQSKAE